MHQYYCDDIIEMFKDESLNSLNEMNKKKSDIFRRNLSTIILDYEVACAKSKKLLWIKGHTDIVLFSGLIEDILIHLFT